MNIGEILKRQCRERPNATAIIDTQHGWPRVTTFAELERLTGQAAGLLHETGLRAGDTVLVFYPMSLELYVALLAIFRLRLTAMFLDPSAGREHIERSCGLVPPKALIAGTKAHLLRLWCRAIRQIPLKFVIGWPVPGAVNWRRADKSKPFDAVEPCEPGTPALLTFTSGSTGLPKVAVRTHGFLLAQHRVLEKTLGLTPGDIDLTTLPIFLLANLASGVTSIVPDADLRAPGAIDPAPVLRQIEQHRPTSSTASPAFFERLYWGAGQTKLTSFRKVFTGGAPVFPLLLERLQKIAPEAQVEAVYGSTEAEPIAHVGCDETQAERQEVLKGRGLPAGKPIEEIRLTILENKWGQPLGPFTEAEFQQACLGAGRTGEIVVSGDHVLQGYLDGRGDEETKIKVDGKTWHRTGDAGYLDDRGRLWLLGRCSARIQDAHGEQYPFAVEAIACCAPTVRRAALVPYQGKRVLLIEFRPDAVTPRDEALEKFRLLQTSPWVHVDEVRECKAIPVDKRHNAKIDYPALMRMLEKG
jgi:acyl-CoA synthetase (AMP-forming)/AMP-acid ligase II